MLLALNWWASAAAVVVVTDSRRPSRPASRDLQHSIFCVYELRLFRTEARPLQMLANLCHVLLFMRRLVFYPLDNFISYLATISFHISPPPSTLLC